MPEDEQDLYDFCSAVLERHQVDNSTWSRAVTKFGEQGVVDANGLLAYYVLLAMEMNTAQTPLPNGAQPMLQPLRGR